MEISLLRGRMREWREGAGREVGQREGDGMKRKWWGVVFGQGGHERKRNRRGMEGRRREKEESAVGRDGAG